MMLALRSCSLFNNSCTVTLGKIYYNNTSKLSLFIFKDFLIFLCIFLK